MAVRVPVSMPVSVTLIVTDGDRAPARAGDRHLVRAPCPCRRAILRCGDAVANGANLTNQLADLVVLALNQDFNFRRHLA